MAQSEVQCDIFSPSDKFSETCRNVVKALTREPLIALDSEGVNLGRDGPLTLLQIGTLSGRVYLFDIMLTEDNQDKDFFRDTGLEKILTSKEIVKVIQSCSGDSAALFNQFGIRLENVFDTQKKALESTQLKEILDFPTTIQDMKTASLRQYLAELDQNMTDPATFNPPRDIFYKLNEIEEIRDDVLKSEATRIKKQVKAMVLRDIEAKYDRTTRAQILTETEIRVLRSLKPLSNDEPSYSLLVLDLHWKTAEHDIDESMKMLENDMHEIPISISKLRLYISKEGVPQSIKRKAQLLFDKYETVTLNRIQQSYSASTKISELSDQEKKFLAALKITSNPYGPVVNALHWNITYENLCKDIQEYRAGRLQPNDGLIGRIGFLAKNSTVPPDVQTKAKEFLKLLPRRQPRR